MASNKSFPCAIILFSSIVFLINSSNAMPPFNVQRYGARGYGKTDSTEPFLTAWSLPCGSEAQAMVYIPHGTYLVRNLVFSGPCKNIITFKIDGKLVAPKTTGSISFSWCNNVLLSGLTSLNSQNIHVTVHHSSNVRIQNIRIRAPTRSPNTDGIIVQSSSGVTISRGVIGTGDDCIALNQGSVNIWIERVHCGPGHGISIGSLGDHADEEGVKNVTVTNSVFTKTRNGVRIKSWARPSSGFVRNVVFRNLVMRNVDKWSDICKHKGTSRTPIAVKLDCSGSHHCTGIRLKNINLTYMKGSTTSFCKNAHGRASGVVVPMNCSSKFECDEAFGLN
ncbi:hypothetical protein Bca52824_008893 [Brassica carinata]|uniref:Rhamnogalacturonase A/B/Epimerase-like pectate lyase domain-containing protein n=1 Tax=Brassica carinata TaxID=52824 RepID=A0A8X7WBL6_BRACI|nr:hypothetical protein Bca52824_008893 [Brassica carinata]